MGGSLYGGFGLMHYWLGFLGSRTDSGELEDGHFRDMGILICKTIGAHTLFSVPTVATFEHHQCNHQPLKSLAYHADARLPTAS